MLDSTLSAIKAKREGMLEAKRAAVGTEVREDVRLKIDGAQPSSAKA